MEPEEDMKRKYPVTMGRPAAPFPCQRKTDGQVKEDLYYAKFGSGDVDAFFRKWTTLASAKRALVDLIQFWK